MAGAPGTGHKIGYYLSTRRLHSQSLKLLKKLLKEINEEF